jgi:hypothetical protein
LSRPQKDALAEFITRLHSTTFLTPSLFVNVRFTRPEPAGDYYLAGKPQLPYTPNRIMAVVRVSPTRTKDKFDEMAVKIHEKWDEVVNDPTIAVKLGNISEKDATRHRKLHFVVFHPMVAAVEKGIIIAGVRFSLVICPHLSQLTLLSRDGAPWCNPPKPRPPAGRGLLSCPVVADTFMLWL